MVGFSGCDTASAPLHRRGNGQRVAWAGELRSGCRLGVLQTATGSNRRLPGRIVCVIWLNEPSTHRWVYGVQREPGLVYRDVTVQPAKGGRGCRVHDPRGGLGDGFGAPRAGIGSNILRRWTFEVGLNSEVSVGEDLLLILAGDPTVLLRQPIDCGQVYLEALVYDAVGAPAPISFRAAIARSKVTSPDSSCSNR